jgi:hypothetical protein
MARASLDLIKAMYKIAEECQPITGRGVGYKLFVAKLTASMADKEMAKVYRLLKIGRERGDIPWAWIVDETRELERVSTWSDPEQYAKCIARSYRRDFWDQQPRRVEVWSEKGTIRGVLKPVLDQYAVGFRVMHGFTSATAVNDVAEDDDGRDLIVLYVGDIDPSGMYMSEVDLPARFKKYDGGHIKLKRIALTVSKQLRGLPSFPAADKGPTKKGKGDPRYGWFVKNYGDRCWEIDAMDPNDLRSCVEGEIKALIEPVAWARCETVNKAELESCRRCCRSGRGGRRMRKAEEERRRAAGMVKHYLISVPLRRPPRMHFHSYLMCEDETCVEASCNKMCSVCEENGFEIFPPAFMVTKLDADGIETVRTFLFADQRFRECIKGAKEFHISSWTMPDEDPKAAQLLELH